jgi:hypothetical protein
MSPTVQFEDDLGSGLSYGKPTAPLFVTMLLLKKKNKTFRWCAAVFVLCQKIRSFSVVFYVVTGVHKFVFLACYKRKTPNTQRPEFV